MVYLSMFKRVLCLSLMAVLTTSTAKGQDVKDIPPGSDRVVPIKEGDKAPFSGQLFDNPTALRWANWVDQYRLKLKSERLYFEQTKELEKKWFDARISAEQDKYKSIISEQE